jgi:hypothetical protein
MSDTSKLGACKGVVSATDKEDDDSPEMVKFVQELTRSRPKADREQEIEAGSLVQKQFALLPYPDGEESWTNDNVEFASHRRDEEFDDSPSHRRDEEFDDSPSHRRDRDQEYGRDDSPSPSKKMKKMKKGTICQECKKDYGTNLNRHMKTHLPDDSPEKIAWKAKINPIQAEWHREHYHNNSEHQKSEKLRSVRNNFNTNCDKRGLPRVGDGWTPDVSKRVRKHVVLTPGSDLYYSDDDDEFPADHGRSCIELL